MSTLRCIAVDDEPLALEVIRHFAAKVPGLELVGTYANPLQALERLRNEPADLVFLDIHMPDLTGLQLLESLHPMPMVIFTTAYSQYAVDSYERDALDYLLKPILFDRFLKAVNKAFREQKARDEQPEIAKEEFGSFLFIKSDTRYFKVELEDILFIEGMRDYVAVHTPKQKILTLMSMTKILEKLPPDRFMRVHKSFIVGIRHIDLVQNHRIKIGGKEIPISNSYRDAFQAFVEG